MEYLFVYGTLQQNFSNNYAKFLHSNAEIIGKGNIPGKLYRISWYPGAVYNANSDFKVYGTIFQLKNASLVFDKLDEYEGVGNIFEQPNEYVRKKVDVSLEDGTIIKCWVYLYNSNVDENSFIESGVFINSDE